VINLNKKVISIVLAVIALLGCRAAEAPQLKKTSLELLAIQSREFETNKKIAFAAVLSVFQDLGYIVNSAELGTGFITAKSPIKNDSGRAYSAMTCTQATAFVEELKKGTVRIRLNFLETTEYVSDKGRKDVYESAIEDPIIYQNAFTRIGESLFVRKGTTDDIIEFKNEQLPKK
jgi:hypothetical protein